MVFCVLVTVEISKHVETHLRHIASHPNSIEFILTNDDLWDLQLTFFGTGS